jgi:pyridinium-3,5-biscarboxylic acid mononucleotide synthase
MLEFAEIQIDWDRERRTGVPEAALCEGKAPSQIGSIVTAARAEGRRLLLTRLCAATHATLAAEVRDALDYDPLSATAVFGGEIPVVATGIGIVAAGTSDLAVAREAARTLAFMGHSADIIADVGVAGLWRLTTRLEQLRSFRVLIAVAGMEGALFSVLAGLVEAPVVAVPTSVGYGVAKGGKAALLSALASCAPGLVVVNIDNGFGAAAAALKMLRVTRV